MRMPAQIALECVKKELINAQDNCHRAESTFGSLSVSEMQEQYGQSGKTKREILDGYTSKSIELQRAIQWLGGR